MKTSFNQKSRHRKFNRRKIKWPLKLLIFLLILTAVPLVCGASVFFYYVKSAPPLEINKLKTPANSKIYDQNGELLVDLGSEKRELLTPTEIPDLLANAIVSIEDRRFYQHHGIDPIRIGGSLLHNFSNHNVQGGSTLDQQLIKLSYFSTKTRDKTIKRKAQEAWLALELDQSRSKQEILTYYANKVFMGNRLYGMKTAAKTYYHKEIKNLTLAQTALLAGIPQAPGEFNPYLHPQKAKNRRDTVLNAMLENHKITTKDCQIAMKTPIDDGLQPLSDDNKDEKLRIIDPYLTEVAKEVQEKTGKDLWKDGLEVYTNLDYDCQEHLYQTVNTDEFINFPDDQMQIAATLVDAKTGFVKAQIGGRKLPQGVGLTNQATLTDRDWGSTMKPLVDYAPFLAQQKCGTNYTFNDSKYFYPNSDVQIYDWDRQYLGTISMREAIKLSRNVPAVQALEQVGLTKAQKYLQQMGINFPNLQFSNAISSNYPASDQGHNVGVSSLKIATAYATFADNGVYHQPQYVNKIRFADGHEEKYETHQTKVFNSTTSYLMTDLLKSVLTYGTGKSAKTNGLYEAGKTGTSGYSDEDYEQHPELKVIARQHQTIAPDESFVGYTRDYALSVWCGYKDRFTPVTDQYFPVPGDIYKELINFAMKEKENRDWKKPKTLVKIGSELYYRGQYHKNKNKTNRRRHNHYYSSTSETTDDDNGYPELFLDTDQKSNNSNYHHDSSKSSVSPRSKETTSSSHSSLSSSSSATNSQETTSESSTDIATSSSSSQDQMLIAH